jgi:oxygen-dependent protoporphyrinogen oxidase
MDRKMKCKRVVVVGGGITGLAAAHRLCELAAEQGQDLDLTILEAGDRPGGVIHTIKQDGFLCEAGPDNFVTNKPWALALCRRLGLEDQILPTNHAHRSALVVRRGRLLPIPEGFMLMAPTKILPMALTPLFSLRGKMRMAMDYFIPATSGDEDESLASFVTRRFGREALDRVIQPLIGGIYTADPETLSLRATMPQFLDMEARHGSIIRAMRKQAKKAPPVAGRGSGARYGLFVTLRNGLQTLVEALVDRIGPKRIRCHAQVTSLSRDAADADWSVHLSDGTLLNADAVLLAGPRHVAAKVLRNFDNGLADQLGDLSYATSGVIHLAYRRDQVPHPLDAFGFVVPAIEKRNLIAVSFTSIKYAGRAPDDWVLLRAFVGGAMNRTFMDRDDAALIAATRQEFQDLLGITADPGLTLVHRHTNSMPQYAVGHLDRVEAIHERFAKHNGLESAGNGFEGVGMPDCIHSGEQAAERLFGATQEDPS